MTISTSEVKYGKCPQCGEQYQINGDPHFCPPKKRLPRWLKDAVNEQLARGNVDLNDIPEDLPLEVKMDLKSGIMSYQQALVWVLSLEE